MVRRFLDQTIKDRNVDSRRDVKTAQGAAEQRTEDGGNKETALNVSPKDSVRKVTCAALCTMKTKKGKEKLALLPETEEAAKVSGHRKAPAPPAKRPASLVQVHAGKMHDSFT